MLPFISVLDKSQESPFTIHSIHFSLLPLLNDKDNSLTEEPYIHKFLLYQNPDHSGRADNSQKSDMKKSRPFRDALIFILTKNYHLIKTSLQNIVYDTSHSTPTELIGLNVSHLDSSNNVNLPNSSLNSSLIGLRISPEYDKPKEHSYILKFEDQLRIPSQKGRFSGLLTKKYLKNAAMLVQTSQNRLIILVDKVLFCVSLDLSFEIRRVDGIDKVEMIALNKQNEDEVLCLVPHGRLKFIKILPQIPGEQAHSCVEVRESVISSFMYHQQQGKIESVIDMKLFNNYIAIKFSTYYIIIDATSGRTLVNSLRHENDKTRDFSSWPRLLEDGSGMFTHFCPIVGADSHIFLTDEKRKGPNWTQSICCDYASPFVINCDSKGIHFYGTYWDDVIYSKMDFKNTIDMCSVGGSIYIINKTKHGHSLLIFNPIPLSIHKKRLIFSTRYLFKEALELHNQDYDNQIEELLISHESILESFDSQHNKILTKLNLQLEDKILSKESYEEELSKTQKIFEQKAKEEKQLNRKRVQIIEKIRECEERQLHVYAGLSLIKKKDFHNAFLRFRKSHLDIRYFTPFLSLFKVPTFVPSNISQRYLNPIYSEEILSHNIEIDSGYLHTFSEELLKHIHHVQLMLEEESDTILEEKYFDALFFSMDLHHGIDEDENLRVIIREELEEEKDYIRALILAITNGLDDIAPIENTPDVENLMKKVVSLQVENRDLKDIIEQMKEQMILLKHENKALHQTIKKFTHQHSLSGTDITSQWTYDESSFHSEDPREDSNYEDKNRNTSSLGGDSTNYIAADMTDTEEK